jgi:hypothetical protein
MGKVVELQQKKKPMDYFEGISFIGIPTLVPSPSLACPISDKITCGARPVPEELVNVADDNSLGAEFKLEELGVGGDIAPETTGGGGG